jgi:hypothetical protein
MAIDREPLYALACATLDEATRTKSIKVDVVTPMRKVVDAVLDELVTQFGLNHSDWPIGVPPMPAGLTSKDIAYQRSGNWAGWVFVRHPDGQWVSAAQLSPSLFAMLLTYSPEEP